MLKETKTRVRRDPLFLYLIFEMTFTHGLIPFSLNDHSPWVINYLFSLTEIKEAISAVGDGETKPASPSSSPPARCTPPSLEIQPSSAVQVLDIPLLSSSQSVKASSTPGEGRSSPRCVRVCVC